MGRWDFGSDQRLARAVIVDEFGPDEVDVLEYLARQSRADDGRRPSGRQVGQQLFADGGERPDECTCTGGRLENIPCFHCVQAGYTTPNPDVTGHD